MSDILTHLLGYLTPDEWADTFNNYQDIEISPWDAKEIFERMKEQEQEYSLSLIEAVVEQLTDEARNEFSNIIAEYLE